MFFCQQHIEILMIIHKLAGTLLKCILKVNQRILMKHQPHSVAVVGRLNKDSNYYSLYLFTPGSTADRNTPSGEPVSGLLGRCSFPAHTAASSFRDPS